MAENHVTPEADSFAALARDLRALKLEHASHKSLEAIAHRSGVSTTTLSDSLNGKVKPSARTIMAVVTACGQDPAAWLRRRERLVAEERDRRCAQGLVPSVADGVDPPTAAADPAVARVGSAVAVTGTPAAPVDGDGAAAPKAVVGRGRRRVGLGTTLLIAGLTAVVTAVATSATWAAMPRSVAGPGPEPAAEKVEEQVAATASLLPYGNGVDPMRTECRDDRVLAASERRGKGKYKDKFLVEYFYSHKCMAVWGQVTRYDNRSAGNWMAIEIYPQGDRQNTTSQSIRRKDIQTMYSPMRIEPTKSLANCVLIRASVEGREVDLGPALCA